MDVNLLTDGEESSVEEILDVVSLDDDSEMGHSDTTIQTDMVVVKMEGKEYAPTVNALAGRSLQNNGRKSVVEDLEEVDTREVVDLSGRDMFQVAATKEEMRNEEKKKALKNAPTVS